jgi:hypothetical protein
MQNQKCINYCDVCGAYAEKDAELTLELFKVLSREIQKQNLSNVFDLENSAISLFD